MNPSHESNEKPREGLFEPPDKSLRILCIEDSDGDYALLREHLRDAAFQVAPELVRAVSLQNAVSLIEESGRTPSFDLILLDLSLPDSHGPETLDHVNNVAHRVPVIILSGNEDHDLAVKMVQRGAQDYLPKHFLSGDLLLRSILYALERHRSRLEMSALNERLSKATHDLKTAQMHLIQVEKLDSLGRLAAGVAHEVKNPLATLQMGVDYFKRREDQLDESGLMMVKYMQEAIISADGIISGMVDYSRSDALELKLQSPNIVVRRALSMIRHEIIKHNVRVESDLTLPIQDVSIDEGKIAQVLINVLMNGIQAMVGAGVEPILHIKTLFGKIEAIDRDLGLREYDRIRVQDMAVVIEVRDEGPGVPQDKMNRLFEPFYTTKPTGEGTGLGLSVAKNIVDLHRGHFQISNVENPRGFRVRIFLKARQSTGASEALSPELALTVEALNETESKPHIP